MPPVPDSLAADDVAVDVDGGASESSAADDSEEESKLSKGFGGLKNKAKAAADKALAGKRQHICIASLAWIVLKLAKLTPHWTGCSG